MLVQTNYALNGVADKFIGNAVNTASRLEALSKTLGSRVVISADVFDRISPEMRAKASFLGEFELKGKVGAYGIV